MKLYFLRWAGLIGFHPIMALTLLPGCSQPPKVYDTLHDEEESKSTSAEFAAKQLAFTEKQRAKLTSALEIATRSVNDSLFRKILNAQATADVYAWDYGRLDRVTGEQHRQAPVAFFLAEFQARGLPTMQQFIAKDSYSNDDVTGSTPVCSENINFNVDNLDRSSRTPTYVAGTIVHERVHSFCFQHRSNNVTKEYNLCDFAYHAGHLAIVLALYRANNSQPIAEPSIAMCPSLIKRLQDENIIKK